MRRFLLSSLLSAVVAMSNSSAFACINDREADNAEREFKSQYHEKPAAESPSPISPPGSTGDSLKEYGPLVLGGTLLVGSMVQVRRKSKGQPV
jgi:hypothetical protein